MADKPLIITNALPYANGSLHIGHMVGHILSDAIARAFKLSGRKVIFCCAEDTHGTPIALKAEQEGVTPKKLIDKYYKEHLEDLHAYHISFDSYYSTNTPENKKLADYFFNTLKSKNLIHTKDIKLPYCETDKRFLPDRYIKGTCPKCGAEHQYGDMCEKCGTKYEPTDLKNPVCVLCSNPPTIKKTTHYFFTLGKFADDLADWLQGNKTLQPEMVNQHMFWLQEGLRDWDISRDGPYFGFKIPGEANQYYYVWMDAPIGYISSLANYFDRDTDKALAFWNKSETLQILGKDIVYFHFLFWPAMLKGVGLNLPSTLLVHGFLTVQGEKMSKSRGTFFTAKEFAQMSKPELLRYYYARNLGKKVEDINLDFKDYVDKVNNELVANIANFIYRTLSFCNKYLENDVTTLADKKVFTALTKKAEQVVQAYHHYNLREAVNGILAISAEGNKFFQSNEPWNLIKKDKNKTQKVITQCASIAKMLTILLKPILPVFAQAVEQQLGLDNLTFKDLTAPLENRTINKAEILLKKIEPITINQEPLSLLNLKVGVVKEVKDHPDAEKLFILQVDLGTEQRQLVAGLRKFYDKDALTGKHLVIVTNLKPAKLRGQLSQGMLLAAEKNGKVKIVEAPDTSPGAQVSVGTILSNEEEITIDDFSKVKLTTKDGKVVYGDKPLKTEKGDVMVDIEDDAEVR